MKKIILILLISLFSFSNLLAKRTITLGIASTEIAINYLESGELIGCDSWSKEIDAAKGAVDLGSIENISYDLIKELKPEIIIVDSEFAFFGNKEKLNSLGFKVHYLPSIFTKVQMEKNIETIAKLVGKANKYSEVKTEFRTKHSAFELAKTMNSLNSEIIYIERNYKGGLMIAGKSTTPNEILKQAGNKLNLKYDGWVDIDIKEIEKLNPEYIIITDKVVQQLGGNDKVIKFFENTNAGKEDKVVIIEDWELRSYGIYVSDFLLKIMGTFNENNFK